MIRSLDCSLIAFVLDYLFKPKTTCLKHYRKSVPRERWGEFFDQFLDGNRGRHISIEIIGGELGDAELVQNAPLMAMIYDRPGKGDDLVIEVGQDEVTYAHTVDLPTEVWLYRILYANVHRKHVGAL
jgi:hypothetical protein